MGKTEVCCEPLAAFIRLLNTTGIWCQSENRRTKPETNSKSEIGIALAKFIAEWTGEDPARSHKPFDAGSNPASATWAAEYANPVKRPGREPGERLWVRLPPRLLIDRAEFYK